MNERPLKCCVQTDVIKMGWWRECKDVSCLSFAENAISMVERGDSGEMILSEEVVEDLSDDRVVERLHPFGNNVAVGL